MTQQCISLDTWCSVVFVGGGGGRERGGGGGGLRIIIQPSTSLSFIFGLAEAIWKSLGSHRQFFFKLYESQISFRYRQQHTWIWRNKSNNHNTASITRSSSAYYFTPVEIRLSKELTMNTTGQDKKNKKSLSLFFNRLSSRVVGVFIAHNYWCKCLSGHGNSNNSSCLAQR